MPQLGGPLIDISAEHLFGDVHVIEEDPTVREIHDAVYVPCAPDLYFHTDTQRGLYRDGELLREAAYIRGPGDTLVGHSWRSELRPTETAADDTYIYMGMMHAQFRHFLLSSMERFWFADRSAKLLVHGKDSVETWFSENPFIAKIFGALGLTPSQFVTFTKPCRIRHLIVPAPSFRESHTAHMAYGRLGAKIGAKLLAGRALSAGPPVYLSKQRLVAGVWRVINEEEVVDRLVQAGVEIVFPETLPLEEQLVLFQTRRVIAMASSSLHVSALGVRPCDMLCVTREAALDSSFAMLDRVKGNRARYLAADPPMEYLGPAPGGWFAQQCRTREPVVVAESLLRALDAPSERASYLV